MPIPETNPPQGIEAISDAELQQELRSLFIIDTQNYLQRYRQITQNLQIDTWKTDIQELYRCIHTIKGGAVTVAAEAVLQLATALEDVLADLRYLDLPPPLTDNRLSQALLEAGELLTGTLELQNPQETKPLLDRIQALHETIQAQYLPQWNELKQLHQDFAEQGLGLVVLELEIALERLPDQGTVPPSILTIAQQTIAQLQQIGKELQFASGWADLLHQAQTLFTQPENAVWRSQWLRLFQTLKTCAKQSGNPVDFNFEHIDVEQVVNHQPHLDLEPAFEPDPSHLHLPDAVTHTQPESFLDDRPLENDLLDLSQVQAWLDQPIQTSELTELADSLQPSHLPQPDHLPQPIDPSSPSPPSPPPTKPNAPSEIPQIPVPLEKLDRSAQCLVNTLLSLRTTQGGYQTLQNQISQVVALAQEGIQYITQLRQIQDDYALLSNLSTQAFASSPTPERYRQGYSIINRLLETSLRLSEIGAEAGKTAQQVDERMRTVETSVLQLQNTVEDSRLVPFSNLGLRARAILRDLTTRYGKPAQFIIEGEQTELDVGIVRNLEPALLHLIRNAYDHGLESPAERVAQGKPEQGTLMLTLKRQGNLFQLQLVDDGRGIDPQTIRARAETLNLPLTTTQTPADLLAVICQPGFTSETQVSEISGRGIGMDAVAAQVTRLGGYLSLHTTSGRGTTFRLQFPVPRLLVPCVVVQAGQQPLAIPVDNIKTITLLNTLNLSQTKDVNSAHFTWKIQDNDRALPALDLCEYWQRRAMNRSFPDTAVGIYINAQDVNFQDANLQETVAQESPQGVWLLADELLEQSELMITPLPTPMVAPKGLIGLSLQPNGSLIPVLEAHTFTEAFHTTSIATVDPLQLPPSAPSDSEAWQTHFMTPTILVVDDAALMRRRLEASLNAYGFTTHLCADGQEAWNWLQEYRHPSLVITDIEMPTMDGFTLIDRCRQAGITVPILVISSRLSEEWCDEAKRLGATAYLTKGFSTAELINSVNTLVNHSES